MNTNIMKIRDGWDLGYVLDWHVKSSEYLGDNEFGKPMFDTKRTEIGEALFQTASFVIPIPPSKNRDIQPAIELAKIIAKKMNLPFFENILLKRGTTPQVKDIETTKERVEALTGCFYLNDAITNSGCWDVLVIDDLYSFGASLSAATQVLRSYKKVGKIFVAAFSRTK